MQFLIFICAFLRDCQCFHTFRHIWLLKKIKSISGGCFICFVHLPYVKEETEAVLHPSGNSSKPFHYAEYQALIDKEVKEKIEQSDINLVNFQYEQKADLDR